MNIAESLRAARGHVDRFVEPTAEGSAHEAHALLQDEWFCALAYLSDRADTYSTGPAPDGMPDPPLDEDTTRLVRNARNQLDQALRSRARVVLEGGGRRYRTDCPECGHPGVAVSEAAMFWACNECGEKWQVAPDDVVEAHEEARDE